MPDVRRGSLLERPGAGREEAVVEQVGVQQVGVQQVGAQQVGAQQVGARRTVQRTGQRTGDVAATHEGERVMGLLSGHVPLSLLMDLVTPSGPASREILAEEGEPEQEWWARG